MPDICQKDRLENRGINKNGSILRGLLFQLITALLGLVLFVPPVYAYLDPGTGSMILQALLASIAGSLIVLKVYWNKLKQMFTRGQKPQDDDNSVDSL